MIRQYHSSPNGVMSILRSWDTSVIVVGSNNVGAQFLRLKYSCQIFLLLSLLSDHIILLHNRFRIEPLIPTNMRVCTVQDASKSGLFLVNFYYTVSRPPSLPLQLRRILPWGCPRCLIRFLIRGANEIGPLLFLPCR